MDKKEALKIVQEDGFELKNLPGHFKKDRKFILKAVKQHGYTLRYADKSLKKDKEVVLEAVKQGADDFKSVGFNLHSEEFADKSLRNDPDILAIVNKTNYWEYKNDSLVLDKKGKIKSLGSEKTEWTSYKNIYKFAFPSATHKIFKLYNNYE